MGKRLPANTIVYDFHDSTDTFILMKLGEVVVIYAILQFHQISSKSDQKQKFFLIARFSVQNFKVLVEL